MAKGQKVLRVTGRLPYPYEVFDRDESYSGTPGFEYALVLGQNVGRYVAGTSELGAGERWQQMKDAPLIVCDGLNGKTFDNVMVLCRGDRIMGALSGASRCRWFVDNQILQEGGWVVPLADTTRETTKLARAVGAGARPAGPSGPSS